MSRFANRYLPFLLIAATLALVIAIAPTKAPSASSGDVGASTDGGGRSVTATGSATRPTCARQRILGTLISCPRTWSGDNGGATTKGVTKDAVNMVVYADPFASFVASIAGVGKLVGTEAEERHAVAVYEQFFNRHFETYGRRVKLSYFRSNGTLSNSSTVARSDAVAVDEQNDAFMTVGAVNQDFLDEAARRHIVNIVGTQMPQRFFADHQPFAFGMLPTTDTMNSFVADFIGKQLGRGSRARFGGADSNPPVNGRPRRYGIVYPTTNPDGTPSAWAGTARDLTRKLARYRIRPAATFGYALDPNSAITQVQAGGARLRDAGVTTLICLCDPITPIFSTEGNAKQGWFPELIQTGYLLQDYYQLGRLYDQKVWSHNFGISSLPMSQKPSDEIYWKAYKSIDPNTDPTPDAQLLFFELLEAFSGLEGAGPRLSPATFAASMLKLELRSSPSSSVPRFDLTKDDYGGVKDARVVWWNPKGVGPDGKPGNYESVDGGRRHQVGHWPSGPANVFRPECVARDSCRR